MHMPSLAIWMASKIRSACSLPDKYAPWRVPGLLDATASPARSSPPQIGSLNVALSFGRLHAVNIENDPLAKGCSPHLDIKKDSGHADVASNAEESESIMSATT